MQAFETALQQQAEVLQRTVQLFLKQEDQDLMQIKEQLNYIPLGQIRQERGDIHQKANTMVRATADALKIHETQLHRCTQLLAAKPSQLLEKKANKLSDLQEALSRMGVWQLERLQKNLATVHQTLDLLKPERTLERGFSITRKGHKSIRNVQDLKVGDVLETQLAKGKIESKIIRLRKDDE
jgi:exodeoxyribonuclease VII large subunit